MPDVGFTLNRPHIHPQFPILQGIYVYQAKGSFNTFLFTNDHSSSPVTIQFNIIWSDYFSMADSPTLSSIHTADNLSTIPAILLPQMGRVCFRSHQRPE